jgi:alpha-galactosidase
MNSKDYRSSLPKPPLGWNSFDCYGSHLNDRLLAANLEAFVQKLKPAGYEYFVIDAGWFRHYDLQEGEAWPCEGDPVHIRLDEFGRYLPSERLFPDGLQKHIDRVHKYGLKFGLHIMRGISREAVRLNLPVKGTPYHAADIANPEDTCSWSNLCYGINMDHPGAQAYYDSMLELVAGWGVDFIKYDDIVHKPAEINAVADALAKTGRDILLSLSPGDDFSRDNRETFRRAQMVRITRDIWDLREDIDISFKRWEKFREYADENFWPDLDMIPFGRIKQHVPLSTKRPFAPRGYARLDNFSAAKKRTFITQRAMAASPLFMGGDLVSSPPFVFDLVTQPEMLACNQNGVVGFLQHRIESYAVCIDCWKTPHREKDNAGWLGIFNRMEHKILGRFSKTELGLVPDVTYSLHDIWGGRILEDGDEFFFEIEAEDVLFIRYRPA